jgi:hypothetical protein
VIAWAWPFAQAVLPDGDARVALSTGTWTVCPGTATLLSVGGRKGFARPAHTGAPGTIASGATQGTGQPGSARCGIRNLAPAASARSTG